MDIWDWLHGLKRWWWMLLVFPIVAAAISWVFWPKPEYEASWTVNVVFDDPAVSNNQSYFDFVVLDDLDQLLKSYLLGDIIYLKLPEDVRNQLSRDEFGGMIHSSRRAREVQITVRGDDPEMIRVTANTIQTNLEDVLNQYMVPADFARGAAVINTLTPISEPALNTQSRMVGVASITAATFLVSVAATGVAEWLRMSYRAKYSSK